MKCEVIKEKFLPLVIFLLRVSTGVIMATHGWGKLQNIPQTTEFFSSLGMPAPQIMVYLAIAGEFLGGLGLIVGLFTPLAAFGVFCVTAVAITKVHWANGLMAQGGGFEYPMTLLFVSLFFIVHGAGTFSIDKLFCKKCCSQQGSCC